MENVGKLFDKLKENTDPFHLNFVKESMKANPHIVVKGKTYQINHAVKTLTNIDDSDDVISFDELNAEELKHVIKRITEDFKPQPQVGDSVERIDMSHMFGIVKEIVNDDEVKVDWDSGTLTTEKIVDLALVKEAPEESIKKCEVVDEADEKLLTYDNVEDVMKRLKDELNFPYVASKKSALGGKDFVSIGTAISLDKKEDWPNNILHNSRYGIFMIDSDGNVELLSGKIKKVRKFKVKSIDDLIAKLNKVVVEEGYQGPENKSTIEEDDSRAEVVAIYKKYTFGSVEWQNALTELAKKKKDAGEELSPELQSFVHIQNQHMKAIDMSSDELADKWKNYDLKGKNLINNESTNEDKISIKNEDWECICGNTPSADGFYPCDDKGNKVDPTEEGKWDSKSYVCANCGRIINQETLEVTGQKVEEIKEETDTPLDDLAIQYKDTEEQLNKKKKGARETLDKIEKEIARRNLVWKNDKLVVQESVNEISDQSVLKGIYKELVDRENQAVSDKEDDKWIDGFGVALDIVRAHIKGSPHESVNEVGSGMTDYTGDIYDILKNGKTDDGYGMFSADRPSNAFWNGFANSLEKGGYDRAQIFLILGSTYIRHFFDSIDDDVESDGFKHGANFLKSNKASIDKMIKEEG